MKETSLRSSCPISYSLDILGDKWALLILRDMILSGKTAYGEFLQSEEKIATNILANRLELLEHEQLISKRVDPEKRSKFIYSLTEKGIDLVPVLIELTIWGSKFSPHGGNTDFLAALKRDKEGVIKKYKNQLLK